MKKIDESKPNRRMVETLLRELQRACSQYYGDDPMVKKIQRERESMLSVVRNSSRYKTLKRKEEALIVSISKRNTEVTQTLTNIRRKYLANGITDQLLRDLNALLLVVNKS